MDSVELVARLICLTSGFDPDRSYDASADGIKGFVPPEGATTVRGWERHVHQASHVCAKLSPVVDAAQRAS